MPSRVTVKSPRLPRVNFDVVVIAASWGGVDALGVVLAGLPADFGAPIVIAQHLAAPSCLPDLLNRRTRLASRGQPTRRDSVR